MRPIKPTPEIEYIRNLYAKEDELLKSISERLKAQGKSIHIAPEEGKLLELLIHMNNVRTIVEIGTLAGYSTIWMARALPENGKIITLEKDPTNASMAREHFLSSDVNERISLIEGDAIETLKTLKGPFYMVFIDADKAGYLNYLEWAESNIKNGGLIIADNTLLFGSIVHDSPPDDVAPSTWKIMREFNQKLADDSRYHSLLFPTFEGMTIAIKKF